MKIMVTGAAGFIGSHLAEFLAKKNLFVKAVDCFLPDSYDEKIKRTNWQELTKYPNIELIEQDLRLKLPSSFLSDVDVIVNEAAMPGLMKSWSDFSTYSACNIDLVQNLVSEAVKSRVNHFIQISTSSVYGLNATGSEESNLLPVSPYGVTKLAAEQIVSTYHRTFGLNFTILRYFSVYGPRQRPDMFYYKLINAILNNKSIDVYGDGNQSRTNTYVDDCVEATFATILNRPFGEIINISGSESTSLLKSIEIIERELGKTANITFKNKRPGDQMHTHGVITKAKSLIGYMPTVKFEQGLRAQIIYQQTKMYPT